MSTSPFDHPMLSALLGDSVISAEFTFEAELKHMLAFEAALAEAEAAEGVIPPASAAALAAAIRRFHPELGRLAEGTARDGVVVPGLVAQLRAAVGDPLSRHVHFGATSQDLIDSSLFIRLERVSRELDRRLADLIGRLDRLEAAEGSRRVMGHTRMQRARPISFAHKIAAWREPLRRHRQRLVELAPRVFVLQFGGAVGDRAELGPGASAVADRLADALQLRRSDSARHAERDGVAEFAGWLSMISGSLGKLGQDVALMAQSEVGELRLSGGGGSSAMPGKHNPVAAEMLVALARFNAGLIGAMHQALIHENERSGSAWTLEWMTLPQMCIATGAGLRHGAALIEAIAADGASGSDRVQAP
jgi:3-carboxy-cis,cis-muconate cycloisomerase